ncbi:N-acetylmuramate alpha-1-phosphate uridylyltransferase MurU [Gilvimarinus chinensis]|uniref:N-acetylmuramate alpha-1-phosphate uridylyltransferase MurU n=1 Tax=Gilvimarinus chinensis TaxID=396005 RepID=UPI0003818383|nr:nucleotidyltransferase family protein [Gilvimarinus chinensis]
MKAMILAAGLGKRMRPLTDRIPKPLIEVRGKPLIEWHLERIARAGITEVVINISYLGYMIREHVGRGERWGLSVAYSEEPEPLETGGAIAYAAKLLGGEPFVLINADIYTDFELKFLLDRGLRNKELGCLILVENPEFKRVGDFCLDNGRLSHLHDSKLIGHTFSGISLLSSELVSTFASNKRIFPLIEVFRWAINSGKLAGEVYHGAWSDIGTPERLLAAQKL